MAYEPKTYTPPCWEWRGERLRAARERAGLKPRDIVALTGGLVGEGVVRDYEHDRAVPTVAVACWLAQLCGVGVLDLMEKRY